MLFRQSNTSKVALRCGLLTMLFLAGGMTSGLLFAFAVNGLPMHLPEATMNVLSALIALAVMILASAFWGRSIARACGVAAIRRLAWAGVISFGPAVILAGITLSLLEVLFVERGIGPALPIHVLFMLLFSPAAFFVAGVGGLAFGLVLKNFALAARLALGAGLAGRLAFLIISLLMDTIGWRVGAPGAAARATMLTVTFVGSLAAALAGGAALGALLFRYLNANILKSV